MTNYGIRHSDEWRAPAVKVSDHLTEQVNIKRGAIRYDTRRQARRVWTSERIVRLLSPMVLVLLWELAARFGFIDDRFCPAPTALAQTFYRLVVSGELPVDFLVSLMRVGVGFTIGAGSGIVLGGLMATSRLVRAAIDPLIALTYPIPKTAIPSLIMLVFGFGETSKFVTIAIAVFYPMLMNTITGISNIDRIYFDVGRSFNTTAKATLLTIAIPGALPFVFAGMRLSWGIALLVLVTAEYIGTSQGLGYLIWSSWLTFSIESMYVGLIVLSLFGYVSFALLDKIERLVLPWKTTS